MTPIMATGRMVVANPGFAPFSGAAAKTVGIFPQRTRPSTLVRGTAPQFRSLGPKLNEIGQALKVLGSIMVRISVVVLSAPGLHIQGPPKCSNTLANFWSAENFAGPILLLYDPFPGLYRGDVRDIWRAKQLPPES
jgi:hypothetical protein